MKHFLKGNKKKTTVNSVISLFEFDKVFTVSKRHTLFECAGIMLYTPKMIIGYRRMIQNASFCTYHKDLPMSKTFNLIYEYRVSQQIF